MKKKLLLFIAFIVSTLMFAPKAFALDATAFETLEVSVTDTLRSERFVQKSGHSTMTITNQDSADNCHIYNKIELNQAGVLVIAHAVNENSGGSINARTSLYVSPELVYPVQPLTQEKDDRYVLDKGTYYLDTMVDGYGDDRMYILFVPYDKLIKIVKDNEGKKVCHLYVTMSEEIGRNCEVMLTTRENVTSTDTFYAETDRRIDDTANIRITSNGTYYLIIESPAINLVFPIEVEKLKPITAVKPTKPMIEGGTLTGTARCGNRVLLKIGKNEYTISIDAKGDWTYAVPYTEEQLKKKKFTIQYVNEYGLKSKVLTMNANKKGKK